MGFSFCLGDLVGVDDAVCWLGEVRVWVVEVEAGVSGIRGGTWTLLDGALGVSLPSVRVPGQS